MIKAVLLDFDGTLVAEDILDVVCEIVGKRDESQRINDEFHRGMRVGLSGLIARINLISGVTNTQIKQKLSSDNYLMPGAIELVRYLDSNNILSILNSGNIVPILQEYQQILGISEIVGPMPLMDGEKIIGISEEHFSDKDYKLNGVKKLLQEYGVKPEETIAIGDSPADKKVFEFAGKSIAINPKGEIAKYADYTIIDSLYEAIEIIERLNNNGEV